MPRRIPPKPRIYNPTGKEVLVLYHCRICSQMSTLLMPPKCCVRPPFFINCLCGAWQQYTKAVICKPHKGSYLLELLLLHEPEGLKIIRKLKDVTLKIDPIGTMKRTSMEMEIELVKHPDEYLQFLKDRISQNDAKNMMFR